MLSKAPIRGARFARGLESALPRKNAGKTSLAPRAKAARKDGALVISVTRTIDGPSGKLRFDISDVYEVDENGVLTLERTQGSRTRKMTFARTGP